MILLLLEVEKRFVEEEEEEEPFGRLARDTSRRVKRPFNDDTILSPLEFVDKEEVEGLGLSCFLDLDFDEVGFIEAIEVEFNVDAEVVSVVILVINGSKLPLLVEEPKAIPLPLTDPLLLGATGTLKTSSSSPMTLPVLNRLPALIPNLLIVGLSGILSFSSCHSFLRADLSSDNNDLSVDFL